MGSALSSIIRSAAGTGAPTNPTSRYYAATVLQYTTPAGTPVMYLARRIIPQPEIYTSLSQYAIVDSDRLDNLSARFLSDPLLFWMICDANGAVDPDELVSQVGRRISIPVAAAIPPGARNG